MASWLQFTEEAPDLAAAVQARLEAAKHHVLATLRQDGSPRVSGTEVVLRAPDLLLGMMPGSRKARDLQRDGRFALHANPGDGSMEGGDAKLSGVAVEVDPPDDATGEAGAPPDSPPPHWFRLSLGEVVLTSIHPDGDRLVIETWRPGRRQRVERA